MKKAYPIYLAALALAATGCQDDKFGPDGPAVSGDNVNFGLRLEPTTRTYYADGSWFEDATSANIFWGAIDASGQKVEGNDQIRIFSPQACAGRNDVVYNVKPNPNGGAHALGVSTTLEYGVQWGNDGKAHDFYAFYPAGECSVKTMTEGTAKGDVVVRATLQNGQSPNSYYPEIPQNSSNRLAGQVYVGNPDMGSALMYARNLDVPFGQSEVGLQFSVLADVLDLTVNGPVFDNSLNVNHTSAEYIEIQNVQIINTVEGSPIAGTFDIDMADGSVSNIENGTNVIQIQPLYSTTDGSGNVTNRYPQLKKAGKDGKFDQLRLRAFLIPGSVAKVSDLQIKIKTNAGDYVQNLNGESTFQRGEFNGLPTGKISRVKLPKFMVRGKDVNISEWMADLDPNIYASELSLPGSWYSSNSVYQSLSLRQQYDKGVRAFQFHVSSDVTLGYNTTGGRPRPTYTYDASKNTWTTNVVGTTESFADILNRIGSFMAGHPKEFCVVMIGMNGAKISNPIGSNLQGNYPTNAESLWLETVGKVINACPYVYKDDLTPNTTIQDLGGKILVKINTNSDVNENLGSLGKIDAMFSRWEAGNIKKPNTVNLYWGKFGKNTPLNPHEGNNLFWCFIERDEVLNRGEATGSDRINLDEKESAISQISEESFNNYKLGKHDTWYCTSVGGYLVTSDITGTRNLAASVNPFTIGVLTNKNRASCPMGLVLMNFAGDPNYSGDQLIDVVLNNNFSFLLNKKSSSTTTKVKSFGEPTPGWNY